MRIISGQVLTHRHRNSILHNPLVSLRRVSTYRPLPRLEASYILQLRAKLMKQTDSLSGEWTCDSVETMLRGRVMNRHHSAFGAFVVYISKTLRHESVKGKASMQ